MNENNINTQTSNNSANGMNFVTGPISENNSQGVQNNNAGAMNFVTQSVPDENIQSRPLVESTSNQTTIPQPINHGPVFNTVSPQPVINQIDIEQNVNTSSQPINNTPVQEPQPVVQGVNTAVSSQNINELNNMASPQPNEVPVSQIPEVPSVLEEPEEKKRNPIVTLLVIVLLTVIGVALGVFLFTKFGNNNQNVNANIEKILLQY